MKGGRGAPTTQTGKVITPPRAHVPLMWPRLRASLSNRVWPDTRVSFRSLAIPSQYFGPYVTRNQAICCERDTKARRGQNGLANPDLASSSQLFGGCNSGAIFIAPEFPEDVDTHTCQHSNPSLCVHLRWYAAASIAQGSPYLRLISYLYGSGEHHHEWAIFSNTL